MTSPGALKLSAIGGGMALEIGEFHISFHSQYLELAAIDKLNGKIF